MAFCPKCGAQVSGSFCGACGSPMGGEAPQAAGPVSNPPAAAGMQDNVAGALCYLLGLITGVLFLVLEPYNRNREIRFHAFQSIFLNIAMIVVAIGFSILGTAMSIMIPILGHLMLAGVSMIVWLGAIVLWLVLMFKTYSGSKIVLPVIGPMAQKQAG